MQEKGEPDTKKLMSKRSPKAFNDKPYAYHHELEVEIESLTNLGHGIARDHGWVIQIPFVLPGELVRARIFRNHKNYSEADCTEVLRSSPDRVTPKCELFETCGGCQYQCVSYEKQLLWKQKQVEDCISRIGGFSPKVLPTIASPQIYGYRSKLTPHHQKPKAGQEPKLGFLRQGSRKVIVDVRKCPIATVAINEAMPAARARLFASHSGKKAGTLLLRDVEEGVVSDPNQLVSERVLGLTFQFKAGEFFQNNPFILPSLVSHVIEQADPENSKSLIDAYCGGGLFGLSGADRFEKVVGIEISRDGFEAARNNALINQIKNADFLLGNAASIFSDLEDLPRPSSLIIDPPRRGCDESFLSQTLSFRPSRIVYVSCDPSTQARDARILVEGGYEISCVQPFDLFPQTRHIENVVTFSA